MRSFRAIPGVMWRLAAGSALNSMGLSFLWSLTTIYVHTHLAASLGAVGLILTAQQGAGLVGSLVGGALLDRVGGRLPLVVSSALGTVSLLAITIDGGLLVYAVAAVAAGFSVGMTFAGLNALAPRVWPEGGRDAFNVVYVSFNLGVAAGPALAGLLATVNFRLTFLIGTVGLFVFFLLVTRTYQGPAFTARAATREPRPRRAALDDLTGLGWPVLVLVGGLLLDWVVYAQWFTLVPDFLHGEHVPLALYSLLWTLNGLLIVLGQPLMQRLVRMLPAVRGQMLVGSLFFLVGVGLLTIVRSYPAYAAAMICSTAGEMLVWPAVPAAADLSAKPTQQGLVQGVVSMAGFAGRTLGPVIGVGLVGALSPRDVFGVLALVILAGGILYSFHHAAPERSAQRAAQDS